MGKEIRVKSLYTRAYYGMLVKDYGWFEVLRRFRKKFKNLSFYHNVPIRVNAKRLSREHKLKVFNFNTMKEKTFIARYNAMDKAWLFFDEDGNSVDIIKELKELNRK